MVDRGRTDMDDGRMDKERCFSIVCACLPNTCIGQDQHFFVASDQQSNSSDIVVYSTVSIED